MQYLYSKKMVYQPSLQTGKVAILEADYELRMVYTHLINNSGYVVVPINSHDDLEAIIVQHAPKALVFNPIFQGELLTNSLERLQKIAPQMHLVSVGFAVTDAQMRQLMKLGVSSHLNRQFSAPRDIIEILKSLI